MVEHAAPFKSTALHHCHTASTATNTAPYSSSLTEAIVWDELVIMRMRLQVYVRAVSLVREQFCTLNPNPITPQRLISCR